MAYNISGKESIDSLVIKDSKERCQESPNEGLIEEIKPTSKSKADQITTKQHSESDSDASEAADVSPSSKEPANIRYVKITNNFGTVIVGRNSKLNTRHGNTIDELTTKIQNTGFIIEELKPNIFNRTQLDNHQFNMKCSRINRSEFCRTNRSEFCQTNRSELCLGQSIEVLAGTDYQTININNNSSIVINNINAPKDSDVFIDVTNNFGDIIVGDKSEINIDVQPNDTIEVITIQDEGVSLDQHKYLSGKRSNESNIWKSIQQVGILSIFNNSD